MKLSRRSSIFHIGLAGTICLAFLGAILLPQPVHAGSSTSLFGYTWTVGTMDFIDISTSGTLLDFYGDDAISAPLTIGFNFPFFENTYTSFYINTNGLLMFGNNPTESAVNNTPIPTELRPNNVIAPFWDDLLIAGDPSVVNPPNNGQVYVKQTGIAPDMQFIVEFKDVTRLGDTGHPMTFEVILNQNGNISFVYDTMTGDLNLSTIGIEDSDGADGVELLYNGTGSLAGFSAADDVTFTYPGAATPRFKMMPAYQSSFLISGSVQFPVTIKNTGKNPDLFNLDWHVTSHFGDTNWGLRFLDGAFAELTDVDLNGYVDTGWLPPSADKLVYLEITAPVNPAVPGAYILGELQATSKVSAGSSSILSTSVKIQAANPAPFIQAFSAPGYSGSFEAVHPRQPGYSGLDFIRSAMPDYDYYNSLAITLAGGQTYLSAWENNQYIFSNIQYALGPMAVPTFSGAAFVQDNEGLSNRVFDRSPSVVVSNTGVGAIAFIRDIYQGTKVNSNVKLALVSPTGNVQQIVSLTNNTGFGTQQELDIPFYNTPRVVSRQDGSFLVTWTEQKLVTGGMWRNIQIARVTNSGSVDQICPFTESTTSLQFNDPSLTEITGTNNSLLGYFSIENNSIVHLWLSKLGDTDVCSSPKVEFPDIRGRSLDMVQLDANYAIIGFVNLDTADIQYARVDINALETATIEVKTLPNPDGRRMETPSLIRAQDGKVIITWENLNTDRLYYALLGSNGDVVTPPMIFRQTGDLQSGLITGSAGASLAPLNSPLVFYTNLPLVRR